MSKRATPSATAKRAAEFFLAVCITGLKEFECDVQAVLYTLLRLTAETHNVMCSASDALFVLHSLDEFYRQSRIIYGHKQVVPTSCTKLYLDRSV